MLCALRPTGLIETTLVKNHAIWSHSMSMLFTATSPRSFRRCDPGARDHQSNSWLGPLTWLLARSEIKHQRAGLREIADDPHLLKDLGLTREEALENANRPFWR
jgi:uncharacterized protein YjiS (DUF1127 family)